MKNNRNKHLAVQESMRVSQANESVTHRVTQPVTHSPSRSTHKPRSRSRAPGRYLMRRGSIYYFRKRLPKVASTAEDTFSSPTFFCGSLQTNVIAEAFARAARLLDFYETKRKHLVLDTTQALSDAEMNAVLHDMLRSELARIIREQNTPSTDLAIVDAQIAEL